MSLGLIYKFAHSVHCESFRLQNSRIFANASDGKYSNERSGASEKMARENVERR